MSPIARTWHGRPTDVVVLAVGVTLGSLALLLTAAVPQAAGSPVDLHRATALLGFGLAALVWFSSDRWGRAPIYATLILQLLTRTALIATAASGSGAVAAANALLWLGVYAAMYLSTRAARLYAAAILVGLGAAFMLSIGGRGAVSAWAVVGLSTVCGIELLSRNQDRLRGLSTRDPLTGALNRIGFELSAAPVLATARRQLQPVTVAVLDLDGFKAVNDEHGHAAGDRLLVEIVESWTAELRGGDLLCRPGGDEFVLLLPGTGPAAAEHLIARLRSVTPAPFTAGLAEVEPDDELAMTQQRADRMMYARKASQARVAVPALTELA